MFTMQISSHENDGSKIFESMSLLKTRQDMCDLLSTIEGP